MRRGWGVVSGGLLALAIGCSGSDGGAGGTGGSGGSAATGGGAGTAGTAGSGGSGGGGGSIDAGSDSATDAGSDAPVKANCDPTAEVQQPGTTLCWRLCPLQQSVDAGACAGTVATSNWCDASGVDSGACTPANPGTNLCQQVLGAAYRLPSRAELMALLGSCKKLGSAGINYTCDDCATSTTCSTMFGSDSGTYWASSGSGGNAYVANLGSGAVSLIASTGTYATRCVRDGS